MGGEIVAHHRALFGEAGNIGADVILFVNRIQDVRDILLHRSRRDTMLSIIGFLFFAAAAGFVHRALHGAGYIVSVQNDLTVDVTRRTTDGLNERGF